jgi:membrane protease YdiL (CAAX protease family)
VVDDNPSSAQVPPPPHGPAEGETAVEVPWGFLDAAIVFAIAFLAIGLLSPLLSRALDPEVARGVFFPASLALLGLTTVAWVALRHRAQLWMLFGRRPRVADLGMGVVHGVAGFFVINVGFAFLLQLFATFTGAELPEVQQGLRDAAQDGRIGLLVMGSAVLVAPLAEELYFRGLLFQGLRRPLTLWPAIGVSALIFGIAHYEAGNLEGSLYALIVLSSLGGYLAWVFDRRRTIVAPIVMHATFNGLALAGILLAG